MSFLCPTCKKPYESTYNKGKCKLCRKAYDRARYNRDDGIGKEHSKAYYRKKRDIVHTIKSMPCTDCGITYLPFVMDLDHLPEYPKSANVSRLMATGSLSRLEIEVAKCEVVCANCHRMRTHRRVCKSLDCPCKT